ncbi:MAG: hypothetical protein AB1611_09100 [bacterium]
MTQSGSHLITARGSGLDQISRVILTPSYPHIRSVISGAGSQQSSITALDFRDPYVYAIADYSKILIIHVSDPNHLEIKKTFQDPGFSKSLQSIKISDNYLFITDLLKGLWVIDVSNPLLPSRKALLADSLTYGIHLGDKDGLPVAQERRVYLTNWKSGLKIYDWSPGKGFSFLLTSPITWDILSPFSLDVQVHPRTHERYIYIANSGSAQIVHESSKSVLEPLDTNRLIDPNVPAYLPNIVDVKIKDNRYAYLVDSRYGLYVVDVDNPEFPSVVYRLPLPDGRKSIAMRENLAIVAAGTSGLDLVDISLPSNPIFRHHISTQGNAISIRTDDETGDYVLIANGDAGLALLDIQPYHMCTSIGHLPMRGDIWGVTVSEDHAYLSMGRQGLKAVSIADPWNPRIDCSLEKANTGWDTVLVSNCCVSRNGLYLANGSNLCLFKLSADHKVILPGEQPVRQDDQIQSLTIQGNYLYLLSLIKGLHIFQINPGLNRTPRGELTLGSMPQDIVVQNDVAYVAGGKDGLWTINVSDPGKPQIIPPKSSSTSSLSLSPALVLDVGLKGNYAYLVNGSYGIMVVNVAEKSDPILSRKVEFPNEYLADCAVSGNFLYAAGNSNGIWIMDISNPSSPAKLDNIPVSQGANIVAADQKYIYAGNRFGGFDIYPAPQSLELENPGTAPGYRQDPNSIRFRLPPDLPAGRYDLIFLNAEGKKIRSYQALQLEEQTSIDLKAGLNLFGYPGKVPAEGSTSYQLMHSLAGAAHALWQENPRTVSRWLSSAPGGDNFEIKEGQAYLLYLREDRPRLTLSVEYFYQLDTVLPQIGAELSGGVNWISFPIEDTKALSFEVLTRLQGYTDSNKLAEMQRLNTRSGKWEATYGFYSRCSGKNYPIRPGEGYLVSRE